jgi:hypothetical protein
MNFWMHEFSRTLTLQAYIEQTLYPRSSFGLVFGGLFDDPGGVAYGIELRLFGVEFSLAHL